MIHTEDDVGCFPWLGCIHDYVEFSSTTYNLRLPARSSSAPTTQHVSASRCILDRHEAYIEEYIYLMLEYNTCEKMILFRLSALCTGW